MTTLLESVLKDLEGLKIKPQPPIRVMIVDDNSNDRELIAHALQTFNVKIETAATASEATDMIYATIPYSIAFIDINLPGGRSGFSVAVTLRQLYPNIEIVIVSGYMNEAIEAECLRYGFKTCLKPVDSAKLTVLLSALLPGVVAAGEGVQPSLP